MKRSDTRSKFKATLQIPRRTGGDDVWAFIILPRSVSAKLPRRGRTTVEGTINGQCFQVQLEPDGQRSHWLRIDCDLLKASGVTPGQAAQFEISSLEKEPDPDVPSDLQKALQGSAAALATWQATTTVARVDWIHWIESAKQPKTRVKRISDACEMLAEGKRRVCCFDPSGVYSKALRAPEAAD